MPRLPRLTPAELSEGQRELYDAITTGPRARGTQHFALTDDDGSLNGPFNALLCSPPVGAAQQELGAAIRYGTTLDDRSRELAILLVAARWRSAFEREAHEAVARGLGFADEEVEALRSESLAPFGARESLVGDVTLALLDGDIGDALWEAAASALGTTAVFELTSLVGYYSTLALQLRVFRV